jgi:sterol desaturase/sphingolipid hydroxylase (fatty acid hydroxylase superfamily)
LDRGFELSDSDLQLARTVAFLCALAVAAIVQRLRPHSGRRGDLRVNLSLAVLSSLAVAVTCGSCGFAAARYAGERGVGLLRLVDATAWIELPLALLSMDLVSYGWHRANHTVGFLWRFHQVHHTDEKFTVSTGLRFHPGEILLSLPVRLAATVLLGLSPLAVLVYEALFAAANLFEHGDIDLPPAVERSLGRLLVVPAFHRRHHSRTVGELNKNFGTIFIVWDRALGTFYGSRSVDRFAIGLPGPRRSLTPTAALLLPFEILPGRR